MTPATYCSKFTRMNKNPEEIRTNINTNGILTIDLIKETKEYLHCSICEKWELRLHEKIKLMDEIAEENIGSTKKLNS